jgi:hypothetical protein
LHQQPPYSSSFSGNPIGVIVANFMLPAGKNAHIDHAISLSFDHF